MPSRQPHTARPWFTRFAFGAACGGKPTAANSADKVLRIIHTQNLASLDPIWTTAPE